MHDLELTAMKAAYKMLRGMEPEQWGRALTYLADRLSADDRTAHIRKLESPRPPFQYIHAAEMESVYDDAGELVMDNAESLVPYEVCGVAIVSQRFAVMIPIGDGEDISGHEIEWFDTREAADHYVSVAQAGEG